MPTPKLPVRFGAEFLGNFWLVFGGCGSAIFAALHLGGDNADIQLGIGFLGVALAFGLTVLTMAYAVAHISGAHFNPAVTIGLAVGKRFEWKDVPAYVVAQVLGGLVAGAALLAIASGKDGFDRVGHMAANGYGVNSPGGYAMTAVLIAEVILTAFFLYVILGATDGRAPVADPDFRRRLEIAIEGTGAFRRFKDVLHQDADERTRQWWYLEREDRNLGRARALFATNGLRPG